MSGGRRNAVRHILICGDVGAGKSTLIEKLLRENIRPLSGFVTKRMADGANREGKVYIFPAAGERHFSQENLVGVIGALGAEPYPQVFDTFGVSLLNAAPGALVLMDELGFLESRASAFCEKVLKTLDGNEPVLAAVKSKDTPFLKAVKAHPNADVYTVTEENRDELAQILLPVIREWNIEAR